MRAKVVERWRTELAGLEALLSARQGTFFVEDKVCCSPLGPPTLGHNLFKALRGAFAFVGNTHDVHFHFFRAIANLAAVHSLLLS
jgi:hypothetical protein